MNQKKKGQKKNGIMKRSRDELAAVKYAAWKLTASHLHLEDAEHDGR